MVATVPDNSNDFGANDWLIEDMYDQYKEDPQSVDGTWRAFFESRGETQGTGAPASEAEPPKPEQKQPAAKPAGQQPAATKAEPAAKPVAAAQAEPKKPEPAAKKKPAAKPAKKAPSPRSGVEQPNEVRDARPSKPGRVGSLPADPPNPTVVQAPEAPEPTKTKLRGAPLRTAQNMELSLELPTATSVRAVPMKLVIDQRIVMNNHLRRSRGGKVSFTHLIGYAMIRALTSVPAMNNSYEEIDGKPHLVEPNTINLGLAIDLPKPDGTRQLLVPSIKGCEHLDFAQFWAAYEDLVAKARNNKLTLDDFAGTTASLTNPGGIGTNHSVPRLMPGQGTILGVGSIDYPAEFQGTSEARLNEMGVSKLLTLTSTYDHRVIQGAQSGEFLKKIHELLLGADNFYDDIFRSLRIPYEPIRWATDVAVRQDDEVSKGARIRDLIAAYRTLGHLMADTDPLEYRMRSHPDLDVLTHGLTLWDLDREFPVGDFGGDRRTMKMRDILGLLRDSYCRNVGIEYMHMSDPEQRRWIQRRVERPHVALPREEHLRILDKLSEAEVFETFLQTKFVGQKRFSLEGAESTIVLLDEICELAADDELEEVAIGMPHRGRLNVLANIVGKSYSQIFQEFEGNIDPRTVQGSGDVKYHLGAEGEFQASSGRYIRTSVAANPSHLEAVNPVLEGITRAKQDFLDRGYEFPVLPVLLHGDAAFAGQGVVFETMQMSQLRGYRTGGTIHIVVNNQVGFTTSPTESRSAVYATDVAKAVQAPIFHVNGDDPEACVEVAKLAYAFRQEFNKDVVIDLVCYRRRGHNEGDDPSFTQPLMYDLIDQKRSTRKLYTEALIGRGDISVSDAEEALNHFRERLEQLFAETRAEKAQPTDYHTVPIYPVKPNSAERTTAVPESLLRAVSDAYLTPPENFEVHPKVRPQLERRAKSILEGPIDWATAEITAFGTLLLEGRPVRLTGQDSRRGTFSQRFAAVTDRETGEAWVPLKHLGSEQEKFFVFDSLLSEYAALGFEYGYSVARPDALVLWEAQFGDFVNGAQIIADEFLAAGQAKWQQKSGIVLLLPHGYEGQGPDHSSARIERWLQLVAEDNMAVCQPSTPASYFHLLRQHAYVNWHRPLVVATPKSMLRNKRAASQPEEFTSGKWQPALADPTISDPSKVRTVMLCSGKVRWELVAEREKRGLDEQVAIVAVERLYPLAHQELVTILSDYDHVTDVRWVQDEPENQGPYIFLRQNLFPLLNQGLKRELEIRGVTRPASAAPSVGSIKVHQVEQQELMERAYSDLA
ncbi:multifunctional oxoglutarate decarboxylase/oxoglutarate dehydrogenase thiamine pyrophosphate-binding subunit/dihydrolipoyllysine-residue succinyltransferase subunit [Parenemella sanctibonifatiensis]|uniref:multifunctional oxoglutarate decarboxylase/oxoglutarate dehydrogenase thiamine pyrophosphate-binding subunit/dihydrolipoyllysine-residue succinyltransferase subunit n=1 Tax=Parenemella sanctibonifatiensis TaxID=2016505 RepID=UPI00226C7D1E|nr:multifunctional oxoglutarate decarboxylase/oxoglutarate dehydrogenase thiamine pyrophosphate-binding subunit/dihydrolipoyllysine-residue succinyltransferase subunit [Parenemella sanctibonifatiensis]